MSKRNYVTPEDALFTLQNGQISHGRAILKGPFIVRSVNGRNSEVPYRIRMNNGVKNLLPNQKSLVATFLKLPESHRSYGVVALSNSLSNNFWGGHVFLDRGLLTYQGRGDMKRQLVPHALNQARIRHVINDRYKMFF